MTASFWFSFVMRVRSSMFCLVVMSGVSLRWCTHGLFGFDGVIRTSMYCTHLR